MLLHKHWKQIITPFPGHFQTLLNEIQICLDNIQCGQMNFRPL